MLTATAAVPAPHRELHEPDYPVEEKLGQGKNMSFGSLSCCRSCIFFSMAEMTLLSVVTGLFTTRKAI